MCPSGFFAGAGHVTSASSCFCLRELMGTLLCASQELDPQPQPTISDAAQWQAGGLEVTSGPAGGAQGRDQVGGTSEGESGPGQPGEDGGIGEAMELEGEGEAAGTGEEAAGARVGAGTDGPEGGSEGATSAADAGLEPQRAPGAVGSPSCENSLSRRGWTG